MKYTHIIKRNFKLSGTTDFIGEGITTKATEVTTGYRGRGLPVMTKTLPAGSPVKLTLKQYGSPDHPQLNPVYSLLEIHTTGCPEFKTSYRIDLPIMEAAAKAGIRSWEEH